MTSRFTDAPTRIRAAGCDFDIRRAVGNNRLRVYLVDKDDRRIASQTCSRTPRYTAAEIRFRVELGLLSRGSSLRETLENLADVAEALTDLRYSAEHVGPIQAACNRAGLLADAGVEAR